MFDCAARTAESDLTAVHIDIAASLQKVTEEVMLKMAVHARELTGASNLCLSGGVALNCVGNGHIQRSRIFDQLWIQPASGDAGNALGSRNVSMVHSFDRPRKVMAGKDSMKGSLLGPSFSTQEILDFLEFYDFPFVELEEKELPHRISTLLASGKIIGLFQGRMEFGPRALGGRSIVGDPRDPQMQKKMNFKIKFRESFRPFAPIVLKEQVGDWFEDIEESPYMLLVSQVRKDKRLDRSEADESGMGSLERLQLPRSYIPAVTHVDYSARVQTVGENAAPRLQKILKAFEQQTGVPVLINTSFNLRGRANRMQPHGCL